LNLTIWSEQLQSIYYFPKVYVQDLIKGNAKDITRQILTEKAVIYVCGDVAMAEGVFQTIQQIIQQHEHMEDDKAKDFMRYLKVDRLIDIQFLIKY